MYYSFISMEENVAKQGTYKSFFVFLYNWYEGGPYFDKQKKKSPNVMDWCCIQRRSGETSEHLFRHCEVATTLWNVSFSVFDLDWVMACSAVDLLACWKWKLSSLQSEWLWKIIPSCLLHFIWRERNSHSFEDKKKTMVDLKNYFL